MKKGFTLIELVMVIVILGILAATALPRFIDLSSKAKDSAAKGSLGTIRAAVAITYASNAANSITPLYPATISGTMFSDGNIPNNPYSAVAASGSTVEVGTATAPTKTGSGWYYNSTSGQVWMNDTIATHDTW